MGRPAARVPAAPGVDASADAPAIPTHTGSGTLGPGPRGRGSRGRAVLGAACAQSHGDERFRALFEHAPVGVALCELDGAFSDVNATFRALVTGTAIDPDTGGLEDLARWHGEPVEGGRAWLEDLAAVRRGDRPVARMELPLAAPAGPPRWVEVTAARVALGDHGYLLAHLEDTTPRRLERQRLVRLALHDDLTGLANRTLLAERLDDALARAAGTGRAVAVLYLDLDDFKGINDTFGHDTGDGLLVTVAQRLTGVLRAGDTAGRLGGDEFLVVAADVVGTAALQEVVRRVEQALAEPIPVDGTTVTVSASVGAVLSRHAEQATTVIRRADAAMYAGKRARRRAGHRAAFPLPERACRPTVDLGAGDLVTATLLQEQAAVADLTSAGGDGPPTR